MPNPTKPTTNLTREELEDQLVAMMIGKLHINHPDGVVVESKDIYAAMHHHGTPLIATYTLAKMRQARVDSVQLYMDACEDRGQDPDWMTLYAFQYGQRKVLAAVTEDKENL